MKSWLLKLSGASAFVCLGMFASSAANADGLPAPTGKPILTISGDISEKNAGDTAQFDRDMLEKLGLVTIETTTPWYQGSMKFEGVPMDKLMADVGAKGQRVVAYALNDYTTEIPMEDFTQTSRHSGAEAEWRIHAGSRTKVLFSSCTRMTAIRN